MDKKQRDAQRRDDWLWVMGTEQGRRIVRELVNASGAERDAFLRGAPDQTAYNQGMQSMGRFILAQARQYAPGSYLKYIDEGLSNDE